MPNTLTQRRGWSKEPVRSRALAGDLKRIEVRRSDPVSAWLGTRTEPPDVIAIALKG